MLPRLNIEPIEPGRETPTSSRPPPHRRAWVPALALVPLALALVWRIGELALPPHLEHAWRDADGLGVARCFVREGFDLLKPRVMERGATSGIVGMEFPLVNALGAGLMAVGGMHDWLARLPCWLALVPLLLGGWALGGRLLGDASAAAMAAGCLVLQPLVVIYARKCMPDVPMLAALVWAMALAHDAFRRASISRALAAGSLFALAALLKPTGFAVVVPLALWLRRALRVHGGRPRIWCAAALCAAVPVAATIVWYSHARSLDERYGVALFKLHHDWFEWVRELSNTSFYSVVFGRVFHLYLLWPTVLWMVLRWRDTVETARQHLDLVSWAGAGLVAVILFGGHLTNHPYYALPLLAPLALLMGDFAARAGRAFRRPEFVGAAFMAVFAVTALVRVEQRASRLGFDPARVAAAMAHLPVDGLTIATDERTNVVSLVILDRIGWALPPAELTPAAIARLRALGARTVVETSFGGWLPPGSRAALPAPVWIDDQLRAYVLP